MVARASVFLFAVCALFCLGSVHAECPDGWVVFQDSCYFFSPENVHFTEAEHFCTQHSSHLLHVNSDSENKFIKSFLSLLKAGNWWMGLTDEIIDGIWKWYDTDQTASFTDWGTAQPNNGRASNCACFYNAFAHAWADEPCDQLYHPICEIMTETQSLVG